MIVLSDIPLILAHKQNFSGVRRSTLTIKYIVLHYTSNINDTALNNVKYFNSTPVKASAHYFVDDENIYQSVPCDYPAYSVGLGSMSKPYIPDPPMYKKCTNSNSISIEMCGGKVSRECSTKTKQKACELAVSLMKRYNIPPCNVIRHYDVTGKKCPAWAVEDPAKWLEIQIEINKLYSKEDEPMIENDANYEVFKRFMDRYLADISKEPATWDKEPMDYVEQRGIITGSRPKSFVTRGELATVVERVMKLK